MTAPDLTEKVLGFRQFGIKDGGLRTIGVGPYFWMPGVNRARCLQRNTLGDALDVPPPHDAPHPECRCGLYGWHRPLPYWQNGQLANYKGVVAAILAWGRMEVHREGFRAEKAEVVLLGYDPLVGPTMFGEIAEVADTYGVDAVEIMDFEAAADELGRSIPKELLPDWEFHTPEGKIKPDAYKNPALTLGQVSQDIATQYTANALPTQQVWTPKPAGTMWSPVNPNNPDTITQNAADAHAAQKAFVDLLVAKRRRLITGSVVFGVNLVFALASLVLFVLYQHWFSAVALIANTAVCFWAGEKWLRP
jgi:hypothetical protein